MLAPPPATVAAEKMGTASSSLSRSNPLATGCGARCRPGSGVPHARRGRRSCQARATARVARAWGEVTRRVCRRVSSEADLTRPALLRVDLRDGVPSADTLSAGPPLLFERLARFWRAVPTPLTPAVAALTVRSMRCAFAFFGFAWLLVTCCSARYRSALVAMRKEYAGGFELHAFLKLRFSRPTRVLQPAERSVGVAFRHACSPRGVAVRCLRVLQVAAA